MARLKIGFIPIEGGTYYKEALEEVTRAEELGFDSVWMEEHHAVTNHYWPRRSRCWPASPRAPRR